MMAGPVPIIEAADIVAGYGRLPVLDGVSLSLRAGEMVGLIGESGSGKTTFGRVLVSLLRPRAGAIRWKGRDLAAMNRRERALVRREVQMLFQDPLASLSPRLTVRRLLGEIVRIHDLGETAWEEVEAILMTLGLPSDVLDKYPHQLSGGQARRVGIARALLLRPSLVVADEPTAGLDISVQGEVMNLLTNLRERFGLTCLFISHNLKMVGKVADRLAVMHLGRIVETGEARAVLAAPTHPYTRTLIAAIPSLDPARRTARPATPLEEQ